MNQRETAEKHNRAINGIYWNNNALRIIFEYLGAPGFPGLETGLKSLNQSGNLYNQFLKVHPEGMVITGPNVPTHPLMGERYELCFPAVGSWEYGVDGCWRTIFHNALGAENPPHEMNMQLWQRDTHCLENPHDIAYMGDKDNAKPTRTIFMVDVEYKHKAYENEVILEQGKIFYKIDALVFCIEEVLKRYGFSYLKVMTGKGYNLVGHVPSFEPVFEDLCKIGNSLEPSLEYFMSHIDRAHKRLHVVPRSTELAHKGINRIMQFVTNIGWEEYHKNGGRGRVTTKAIGEGPNLIIDQYLLAVEASMKGTGIPGCPYLRFWYQDWKKDFASLRHHILPNTCIPIRLPIGYNGKNQININDSLKIRNDFFQAMEYLQNASGIIPNCSQGIQNSLSDYYSSELAKLHKKMEEEPFKRFDISKQKKEMPSDLADMLARPDPCLNTSNGLQKFVTALHQRRWHPKDIASIIASAYDTIHDQNWVNYYSLHRRAAGETERILGQYAFCL